MKGRKHVRLSWIHLDLRMEVMMETEDGCGAYSVSGVRAGLHGREGALADGPLVAAGRRRSAHVMVTAPFTAQTKELKLLLAFRRDHSDSFRSAATSFKQHNHLNRTRHTSTKEVRTYSSTRAMGFSFQVSSSSSQNARLSVLFFTSKGIKFSMIRCLKHKHTRL